MNLEQRTAALLAVVEAYREERCAALLNPARAQARALMASALREARRRVRTAIGEERRRLATVLAAAEAQLATERRLTMQRRAATHLKHGWAALRTALQAQWDSAPARADWIASQLSRVRTVLRPMQDAARDDVDPWVLICPVGWAAAERERVAATLLLHGAPAVHMIDDPQLTAGFRVQAGHNVLDATLDGLLADRDAVQGRLLQLIEEPA
jgi:hypothetical protein